MDEPPPIPPPAGAAPLPACNKGKTIFNIVVRFRFFNYLLDETFAVMVRIVSAG